MDKTIKITAITEMAKPRHGKGKGPEAEVEHSKCACPCCGEPCASCESEDESYEESPEEDETEE